MARHGSSKCSAGIRRTVRTNSSAIIAGAAGAFAFSLILTGTLALTGSDLTGGIIYRRAVVQEMNGMSWGSPDGGEQRRNAEQHLNGVRQNYQSRERELKQNFKGVKVDLAATASLMASWKQGIDNLANILTTGAFDEFWSFNGDLDDVRMQVDDAFTTLYAAQNYANIERQFKDNERQIKNMKSDLKRLGKELKGAPEIAQLETFVKTYEGTLASLKSRYTSLDRNDTDAVQDFQTEVNDLQSTQQDFYDLQQDLNDASNAVRTKKEAGQQIKNIQRSIKDQKRTARKSKSAELDALIAEREKVLSQVKDLLKQEPFDAETYWDLNAQQGELEQEGWTIISGLNEQENDVRQDKDTKRTIKDKEKTIKEMTRECKRMKCQGTPLEGIMNEFKEMVEQMKSAASRKEFEEFWDFNSEADGLGPEFWDTLQKQSIGNDVKNLEKNLKNIDRMVQNIKKSAAKVDAATVQQIEETVAQLKGAAQRARQAYDAGDHDGAQEAMQDAHDAHGTLDDLTSGLQGGRNDDDDGPGDLDDILRDIEEAERNISDALAKGTTSKDAAGFCRDLLGRGRELIGEMKKTGGEDGALMMQLGEIGDQVDAKCDQFFDD